jgi:predicted unusual protein kinase regulating ubiquinone biosynthesis (AarF/ABC1/UbiB family)
MSDDDSRPPRFAPLFPEATRGVPTSAAGRLLRTAGAAARAGTGVVLQRVRGKAQPALGADLAHVEQLVRSLGELKGVAMKVGQLLSYVDDTLPPEAQRLLALLQTQSSALPFEVIARTLRAELGARAETLLLTLEPRPAAAASIGQVHRARLPEGTRVAVKVQYPGIEDAIRADFRAAGAGVRFARVLLPGSNVEGFVAEARERLLAECDYAAEAAWQQRFRALVAADPDLAIPEVHPAWSTRRVLTTTWEEGPGFEAWLRTGPPQAERDRIGEALYRFYVGSLYLHGLFNADPHPGNYLLRADGRLVVLDYGCVRAFSPEQVRALAALTRAVHADAPHAMASALRQLGAGNPGSGAAFDSTRTLLRAFYAPSLEDRVQRVAPAQGTRMGELLSDKRTLLQLRLPAELLFLFRIKFGLYALLARLGAARNWHQLEQRWLAEVAPEA